MHICFENYLEKDKGPTAQVYSGTNGRNIAFLNYFSNPFI